MKDLWEADYERELDLISELGYQAYEQGVPFSDCPYKVVPLKQAWESGYMEASFMDEDQRMAEFEEACFFSDLDACKAEEKFHNHLIYDDEEDWGI